MPRPSKFLSREEERALAIRSRAGDERALKAIILAHRPLADKIARQYSKFADIEELQQEAYVGLMQAARRFDPELGHRFSTFARHWARAAVTDFIFHNNAIVRNSSDAAGRARFWRGDRSQAISLETPIRGTDALTLGDTLVDDAPRPDEIVEGVIDYEARSNALREHVDSLDPRAREIITKRHLGDEVATLAELAEQFSISRERVRQIETKALAVIRDRMKRKRGRR